MVTFFMRVSPPGPIFFIFIHFFVKFDQITGWCAPSGLTLPSLNSGNPRSAPRFETRFGMTKVFQDIRIKNIPLFYQGVKIQETTMPALRSLDLEQIVTDWAWREYDATANRRQRKLREKQKKNPGRKYINVNIDWSDVKFKDVTEWPALSEEKVEGLPGEANANADGGQMADFGKSSASILFQTKFTNNTQDGQEYTLKTEKTTRSSCTTEIETSYTKGIEMSVNLKTPGEIFECNAGYSRELTLTNNDGETLEEELTWGVESLIKVKPEHIAYAQLVVNEKKYSGEFIVISKIRGYVAVEFRDVKSEVATTITVHNVAEIVKEYLQIQKRIGDTVDFVEVKDNVVVVRTKGTCQFRFGIRQEVVVNQVPLNGKK